MVSSNGGSALLSFCSADGALSLAGGGLGFRSINGSGKTERFISEFVYLCDRNSTPPVWIVAVE